MHRFWSSVIEPVLRAVAPGVIVEIGADKGANTARILEFCRLHGAVAHVIDPMPKFSVAEWQAEYGDAFIFHEKLSLDALLAITGMDAVLIDGDHNWYTVVHELRCIEEIADNAGAVIPVVFLHDVDWPYGRRDLYYDPETIPELRRHVFERAGLLPGKAELSREGGLNANLANAVSENTERNGVLTALEDFVAESEHDFRLVVVPGWHGLAILASSSLVDDNDALAQVLTSFESETFLVDQCRRIEKSRIRTALREKEKRRRERRKRRELREQLAAKEHELAQCQGRLAEERTSTRQ